MQSRIQIFVFALAFVSLPASAKKKSGTEAPPISEDDSEIADAPDKGVFGDCTERAEMKAGNHYKVYDCGTNRASYYDSPGVMTFDEVTAPISSEARSLGYQVYPSDGTMHIVTHAPPAGPGAVVIPTGSGSGSGSSSGASPLDATLPVKILTHKTPPALGGETKFTVVVTIQPLEGERTRVHDCKIPASADPAAQEAGMTWCNQAFNEMFSFEKSADAALLDMEKKEFEALQNKDDKKPTTVIIGDKK